jgi:hypothetical protein
MDFGIIYKPIKYIVCGAIVFFALKFVIKNDMSLIDIALISVIAMLIFAVVENTSSFLLSDENKNKAGNEGNCKAFCEMKEHMGNISNGNNMNNMAPPAPTMQPASNMVPVLPTPPAMQSAPAMVPKNIITVDSESGSVDSEVEQESEQESRQVIEQESEQEIMKKEIKKIMQESKPKYQDKRLSDYDRFQKRFAEIIDERTQHDKDFINKTGWIDRNDDGSYKVNLKRRSKDIKSVGIRERDGMMTESDVQYDVKSYHVIPTVQNEGSFEYGYSMLPPKDWYPVPPYPPVCVSEKRCPVCPAYTNGTNLELKEWNAGRRITPPDEINVRYVEEKLNSGR